MSTQEPAQEQAAPDTQTDTQDTPPPKPRDLLDDAAEWVRLTNLAEASTAEADEYKAEAKKLQERIIEELAERDMPGIVVGGRNVHRHSRVAANKRPDVDTETFHAALRDAGLEDFIKPTVSASTISGYARELIDAREAIPEGLAAVLNVHIIESLRNTKAAESKATRRRRAAG